MGIKLSQFRHSTPYELHTQIINSFFLYIIFYICTYNTCKVFSKQMHNEWSPSSEYTDKIAGTLGVPDLKISINNNTTNLVYK